MIRNKAQDFVKVRVFPQKFWGGAPFDLKLEFPNDRSNELKLEETPV